MFGSRVGFSGTANLMAPSAIRKIQDGSRRHLGKISNGHISATGRSTHLMIGSWVWFRGTADRIAGAISANDMYGQFTLHSETTSHHITVDA